MRLLTRVFAAVWLLLMALVMVAPLDAMAQTGSDRVPGANPATTPEQVQLYRSEPDQITGRVSIPDEKLGVLVQPEGRDWRQFRTGTLRMIAGALIIGTLVALMAFYIYRGRVRIAAGLSGRTVLRFNTIERATHWLTAVSFIILGLTGLVITFGRPLLIPVMGHQAFTSLAETSKFAHNFFGVPFTLGIVLMFFMWAWHNLPDRTDITWIKEGGGMLKNGKHPKAGRFNAGQKMIFWSVVLGGGALAATGYMLLAPFYATGVSGMQTLHVVHALLAALMIAIIIAHIYIGTVGMEGAFDAMGSGQVDQNWMREHHGLWYERLRNRGMIRENDTASTKGAVPAE